MKGRIDDAMETNSADGTDARAATDDAQQGRKPWTRPRFSRLSLRNTAGNPTFGADGGAAFFTLS